MKPKRVVKLRWVRPDESTYREEEFILPDQQMKLEVLQTKLVLGGCFVQRETVSNPAVDHGDDERRSAHGE